MTESEARKQYKASTAGRRKRDTGALWERIIEKSCDFYRDAGVADIRKTPEPMKPLGRPNARGQFLACFVKQAQPDYKGTIRGGRAVLFDAKHTEQDRISRSVVSAEQEKELELNARLGADCFLLLSFSFEQFFKIPWSAFRDMKKTYGRKYIKPDDIPQYRVRMTGGLLRFMEGDG